MQLTQRLRYGLRQTIACLTAIGRLRLSLAAAVCALQAITAMAWFHQPPGASLIGSIESFPGIVLLVISISGARRAFIRIAATALVLAINYAQYAFAAFYGRFLGVSEIQLTLNNSLREFSTSIILYSNAAALALSMAVTLATVAIYLSRRGVITSRRTAFLALVGMALWSLLLTCSGVSTPSMSAVLTFAGTGMRAGERAFLGHVSNTGQRRPPPSPSHSPADFDVLYVIGESLRADRFDPNRYPRQLTPFLSHIEMPRVAFHNVTSYGDCTGRSVPYLMVAPDRPLHKELYLRPTIFDYAKKSGYRTAFIYANENQWNEFLSPSIDVLRHPAEQTTDASYAGFDNDQKMLPLISALANEAGRNFIVVETYTSHWPYADRYRSCPSCRTYRPDNFGAPAPFDTRHQREITNSYDNSILYFDRFMKALFGALKKPTLVVFTSDHGESLGEGGSWGHCSASAEQVLVPLMFIATDQNVARSARLDLLSANSDFPVSHSNIFATILTYFGYDPSRLDFSYPHGLESLARNQERDRSVLVSEIGEGFDAVSFVHLDAQMAIVGRESSIPK
jgi:glucan phosphoethanolaminetransferase (alkaline phosphatase superfamily)